MSSTPPEDVPGGPERSDEPTDPNTTGGRDPVVGSGSGGEPGGDTPPSQEEGAEEEQALEPQGDDAEDGGTEGPSGGLPRRMEAILERLPTPDRREAEIIMRQMVAQYSGPVPHAGEMARYKEIDPSFPERFVRMAEGQVAHRQELEKTVVGADYKLKRRGQDYALISVVLGLFVAVLFGVLAMPYVAGIVAGTTVIGVVTAFVVGRVAEAKPTETPSSSAADKEES